ncbi:MAG: hypothetical protein ACYTDT_09760 [Planctomycetota bacterium]|jgi:opacity protein-like surface antigen
MIHRILLMLAVTMLATSVYAQDGGMSEDYIRDRADARHAREYGTTLDIDLFGWIPFFDQQFRARGGNLGSDALSLTQDLDHPPVSGFGSIEMNLRFSWYDSIHFQYGLYFTRGFGDFTEDTRWNGTIFPEDADADMSADWHDIAIYYRRDLFRFGLDQQFNFYLLGGLEWTPIRGSVSSDDFPVSEDSEEVEFKELLPGFTLGVGLDWKLNNEWSANVQARGGYMRGFPTFQENDDGEEIRQDVFSIHAAAGVTWKVADWFVLHARVKMRYLRVGLATDHDFERFLFYGLGPELGFGFRF